MKRDVKGMYWKALAGEIKNSTGVDDRMKNQLTWK
jgi:adenylylsulfate kinase-like enzyme